MSSATMATHVDRLRPDLIALRRDFHRHPELAYHETRTAARIAEYLQQAGLRLRPGVARTGLVATAGADDAPGRSVLLRVDLDALPIQEAGTAGYASQVPGRMHACGHDGHAAMGAVAARILGEQPPAGRVHVLFQPAEEGEGGARAALADGVLDGVDLAFGIHLWNELPVGTLGVKAGPLMAAVDRLSITVRGRGGHGGKPHRAADPVVAVAHVISALQTIVAREVSPLRSAVVTIGAVHGGQAFNVIPDEVRLLGTLRTFDAELRRALPERITRLVTGVAEGLQCRAEVEVTRGNPALVNDARAAQIARRAAERVVGAERVLEPEPTMGGEDMAVFLERVPGCFVFVGSANPAKGFDQPHHSPRFDFDEDALAVGCEFLLQVAEEAQRG